MSSRFFTGRSSSQSKSSEAAAVRAKKILRRAAAIEPMESRVLFATGYVPLAPTPNPVWTTGYFTPTGTVDLQAAALTAPDVTAGEAASLPRDVKISASGLPLLESRANGNGLELFIDFARNADGRGTFSLDADRDNFNFSEQMAIYTCWREIVGFFSPFNVNVTTVLPPTGAADPNFSWIQITNDFQGGAAYVGWLSKDGPKGTVNSGDAVNRVSGIIHEYGHNLGLNHQGEFDKYGNKTAEYSDGTDYRNRPIMGVDYLSVVRKMTLGRTLGANDVQDDVAVVANTASWANGAGGDGFRPDDFGNDLANAYVLPAGSQQLDAFTERYNDADVFKITPTTAGPWNLTATPLYLSQAEPKLELLDANGNIIAARDDADLRNGPTNEELLNVNLTPGTYYVRVTSGGDYAELGYYKFAATQLPTGFVSNDVGVPAAPGSVTFNPSTGLFTQSGGGGDIWGFNDQFRYTYATLNGNGSITARVDGLDNIGTYTKSGVMIRQSINSDSAHAFLGVNPNGNIDSIWRWAPGYDSANVGAGVGPWVRITRSGNTFTFQSSSNGTTWNTIGSRDIPMSGPVQIGLATSAWASSRYEAYSTFSNVSVTGNITPAAPTYNGLASPTDLSVAPASGANTSLALSWTGVSGATGYVIERSVDGVSFGSVGTVGSGVTTFTDNPAGSMRYFYRVSAANGTSLNSAPSAVTSAVNKPGAPLLTPGGFTPSAMAIGTNQINLTWLDSNGETGYRIEQSTDGINFVTRYTNPANHVVSNLNNLAAGTNYTFRVTPLTNIGDGAAPSLLINTQTRMAAVSNLRFTARSATSMTIAWNDTPLETGTRVERSTDGTNWTWMGDAAQNAASWTDNSVTAGTEYYYRVMPFNPTYDGITSGAIFAAAPAASLPSGWTSGDIGAVAGGGAAVFTNNTWRLVSGGFDVGGSTDSFHFAYTAMTGDSTIIARVDSVETNNNAAKAGIMIRQDLTAGSKFGAIMMNAGGGYGIDTRVRATANTNYTYSQALANVTAPYYLKLTRVGTTVTASYSTDGTNYTVASTWTLSTTGTYYVGLASSSFSSTQLNTSTFSNVQINSANSAPSVATSASASPNPVAGTTTALSALGTDDAGEANLTYTWSVTGTPPAAVSFSTNGSNAAKNSIATFSRAGSYSLLVTMTDAGGLTTTSNVVVNVSQTLTALAVSPSNNPSVSSGSTVQFTATGSDQFGQSMSVSPTWSTTGTSNSISTSGLFTAGSTAGAFSVTATVGSLNASAPVTVTTSSASLFTGQVDIGNATLRPGSNSFSGGIYTVRGAGSDIQNTSDNFRFVYVPFTGDGEIVARVASVQNTHSWAKAGVMFRETLSANSKNAFATLTPSQGVNFQRRTSTGGSTTYSQKTGVVAPYWVKLVRSGNVFQAFYSSDGTSWTQLGSNTTISMTSSIYVGLAVTSHNSSTLNTSTFSNVSITPYANLASTGTATASSQTTGATAAQATDSSTSTAWQSAAAGTQSLTVDMGSSRTVSRVKLSWGSTYARSYSVQISSNGSTWTTLYSTTTGTGGTTDLQGLLGSGRFLRLLLNTSNGSNYRLNDISVFGK